MKNDKYLSVLILMWSIMILTSCGSGDVNQLTPEERYTVDTIYNNTLTAFRASLDSTCTVQKDTLYKRSVDSLKIEAIKDIEMMFKPNSR